MNWDGERMVPGVSPKALEKLHVARYVHITEILQEADVVSVLDAACGTGYGTNMFARSGINDAWGVDVDFAAVAYARANYGREGTPPNFAAESISAGLRVFADNAFGAVVCLEAIEHVDQTTGRGWLYTFRRLADLVFLSTPNPATSLSGGSRTHAQEYTPAELASLMRESGFRIQGVWQQWRDPDREIEPVPYAEKFDQKSGFVIIQGKRAWPANSDALEGIAK